MDKKKMSQKLESFQETHLNEKFKNITFSIVLVQPEHAGNIGSIARVMENFNFKKLIIFNPKESLENIQSYETQGFAMHGKDILLNSEIITLEDSDDYISEFKEFLQKFDLIIATTAKGKRYTNIKRLALFPEDFEIPVSEKPLNIAILFGKESRGLTNDEIALADISLRIPASDKYPTLNISHACGIILYEFFKKINVLNIGRGDKPILLADKEDRLILYEFMQNLLNQLKTRSYRQENVFLAFKNVFERAFMSQKELGLITGVISKINSILKDINLYEEEE